MTRLRSSLPIGAAILVAIAFFPVIGLEYVWDDWALFINNPALRLPELVWQGLFNPILPGTTYLRPIPLASFALEFETIGVLPSASHAINLALHAGNTLLVGLIAARLAAEAALPGHAWRALIAALLYGLHPALVEPVAWLSGRFDLLVTTFILLGMWGYLAFRGWLRDAWVTAAFLFAAFSKEMAATFPLLLLLLYLGRQGASCCWRDVIHNAVEQREWRVYFLLGLVGALTVITRQTVLGSALHQNVELLGRLETPLAHIAFIGQTLLFYLKMSLWPIADLNPQHPFNPADMDARAEWTGVLALVAGVAVAFFAVKRRILPQLMLAGWAVALLPVLNIVPLTIGGNIGHERFLTLPLAFLALSAATVRPIPLSAQMRRIFPYLSAGIAMLFAALAVVNIRVTIPLWQNELTLWTWAYERHASIPFVQASYVSAALRYGQLDRAEAAIAASGTEPAGYYMKGLKGHYLLRAGNPNAALPLLLEAVSEALPINPPHEVVTSYGIRLEDARITRMNGLQWFYQSGYTSLTQTYLALDDFEKALETARIALFYAPSYPAALLVKCFAYYGLGRWAEGEAAFAEAQRLFVSAAQIEARELRAAFLSKLCASHEGAADAGTVCSNVASVLGGQPISQPL